MRKGANKPFLPFKIKHRNTGKPTKRNKRFVLVMNADTDMLIMNADTDMLVFRGG